MIPYKNIFLVEDDLNDQAFFLEALGKIENANLYAIANNGKEALNRLENHLRHPDIIFMDIKMPVMNGIECLEEIIENPQTRHIPVVMFTNEPWQAELVCWLGAKAVIKKPSYGLALQAKLEQIINHDFFAGYPIASQTFKTVLAGV